MTNRKIMFGLVYLVIAMSGTVSAGGSIKPPPEFVGHWQGQAFTGMTWLKQRHMPIDIRIKSDGNVVGSVGDAELEDARFGRKSELMTKLFKHVTLYEINAKLRGPIVIAEDIKRDSIWFGLTPVIDNRKIEGGFHTSGWHIGDKNSMVLTGVDMELMRVDDNDINLAINVPNIAVQAFERRMAGHSDAAKQLLQKAVVADPQNAGAWFELARVCFYTLFTDTNGIALAPAQKAIEKAVKLDTDNARYHYWAGKIAVYNGIQKMHGLLSRLEMPGQMNKAIEHFKQAVELKPDFHEARLELMGLYDRLPWYCGGNKSKAEQQAKELEQISPVYGAKARCEISPRKSRAEKIAIWEKVVTACPNNAGAYAGLARELMHDGDLPAGDMKKAVEHLDKAIELDSSYNTKLLDLSWHYMQAKEHDRAGEVIQQFVELDPAPPVALRAYALRQLACIKRKQNKPKEEAQALKSEADKLDPIEWQSRSLPPDDLYIAP